MIHLPDRLSAVIADIEAGKPVDVKKLHTLQALDLVRAGRQFVEEACVQQESDDEKCAAAIAQ